MPTAAQARGQRRQGATVGFFSQQFAQIIEAGAVHGAGGEEISGRGSAIAFRGDAHDWWLRSLQEPPLLVSRSLPGLHAKQKEVRPSGLLAAEFLGLRFDGVVCRTQ